MNLASIYSKLDELDRCIIMSILNTYSHDYTVLCQPHNAKNAMGMIAFFNRKKVLQYLKSWQQDYICGDLHEETDDERSRYVRVTRMIKIMK